MEVKSEKSKVKSGTGYTLIRTIRKNFISVYGYTLIEILVALTIIGLLFSFGYASFRDFSTRQAVADVAKNIQGNLRLAQGYAVSGKKPAACTSRLDSYSFYIVSGSEYKIQVNCAAAPIDVKDVILPASVSISTPFPSPNPLKFKVLGQGTNIGASAWILNIVQTGTASVITVTVNSGGDIE